MTMEELSQLYRESAQLLQERLWELRIERVGMQDPEQLWQINRRIAELTPMLTEMNELAELTKHYYDKGYWRNEKYTV